MGWLVSTFWMPPCCAISRRACGRIDAHDVVAAGGEDLGGQVADDAQAGDDHLGRRAGRRRGQRAHRHAHQPGERRNLRRKAVGQADSLLLPHPLRRAMPAQAEGQVARLEPLHVAADRSDFEYGRVARHGRVLRPLPLAQVARQFRARADQRGEGAAGDLRRLEGPRVVRLGQQFGALAIGEGDGIGHEIGTPICCATERMWAAARS